MAFNFLLAMMIATVVSISISYFISKTPDADDDMRFW
jgi:hypothetical protein